MLESLRIRRVVFWYLAADRIVAAAVSRTEREPLLEACAASYAVPVGASCFAPGVAEIATVLGCRGEPHVAALASPYCALEPCEDGSPELSPTGAQGSSQEQRDREVVRARVRGADDLVVRADRKAVVEAVALFRRARLPLVSLDCEGCALVTLADSLGAPDSETARRQHLAAVAVAAEAEKTVEALGEDLAVPVALAVGWFGGHGAR